MRFGQKGDSTVRNLVVGAAGLRLLCGGLGACGSRGTAMPPPGDVATSGAAGAPNGSGSAAAAAGNSIGMTTSGATGSGSAGSGMTGASGSAMTGTNGAGPDAGPNADSGAPPLNCAPGAIFCDGFEGYPPLPPFDPMNNLRDFVPVGSMTPTWLGYHFHGPPYVDASKPFKGKQGYHLNTETGHIAAADIIKESPDGVDLWPAAHYGRVMLFMKAVPPKGPFALLSESGLLPGGTGNEAQYTLGSVNGKVAWIYTQRIRPYKNDVSAPKMRLGGNWQTPAQMPTTMCTVGAMTQAIVAGNWVCVEWMIDRTKPELHVWLDGAAQTEVDVTGSGGTCSAGTAATWTGPQHFTELDLGFEMWGNDGGPGAWEAWYDEFAVGTQRLGCPPP